MQKMQGVQLSLLRFRRQMKNPEDLLRERGIRPTELRKEVLRILFGAGRPLSWKDTFTRFTEKRVNKVSLYRTLSLLEDPAVETRRLQLLVRCHLARRDWTALRGLLPRLRDFGALTADAQRRMEIQVFAASMAMAVDRGDVGAPAR